MVTLTAKSEKSSILPAAGAVYTATSPSRARAQHEHVPPRVTRLTRPAKQGQRLTHPLPVADGTGPLPSAGMIVRSSFARAHVNR